MFAVGAGDDVVGVTFECDYPTEARTRRIVSTSALPEGLGAAEIDRVVSERMRAGEDLYHLDEGALAGLDADLVVTQDLCAVCAVDVSVVDEALAHLGCRAEVLTIDPHTLDEVLASVVTLGRSSGRVDAAEQLVADAAGAAGPGRRRRGRPPRPDAVVLEWTDPPFAPGHWVPEMVARAGGSSVLGTAGEKSFRTTWDAVAASRPRSSWWRPVATTWPEPPAWPATWSPATCCRAAYRCGPWTPTRRSPAPVPGWSTASRRWRRSSTRPDRVAAGPRG